jgi:hypothetical protein
MRTYPLEGRKREKQVGKLKNGHITNKNSPTGGEKEGKVSW